MGKLGLMVHGVLATAAATILLVGSRGEAASVVHADPGDTTGAVASLEASVARTPTSETLSALVSAYLEREQPGLAQAVLDAHPEVDDARITHERARVALAQGDVDHATALSQLTLTMCETDAHTVRACPSWLVAKSLRQASLLEAMQRAGIQDPAQDPVAARLALSRGSREVRLAALP